MPDEPGNFLIPEVGAEAARLREEAKARQKANLVVFRPGESGNPRGRPRAGLAVIEYVNLFMDVDADGAPKYTLGDIEEIAKDERAGAAATAAARWVLTLAADPQKWVKDRRGNIHSAGFDPAPGKALQALLDRLEGTPVSRHEHTNIPPEPKSPDEVLARMAQLMDRFPALRALTEAPPTDDERIAPEIVAESDATSKPAE